MARSSVWGSLWQAVRLHPRRTAAAVALLVLAKAAGVAVPLVLKAIVDQFSRPERLAETTTALPAVQGPGLQAILLVPVFLLLGYSLLRFAGTLFTELRDLVFARVTQTTVTRFAERTYAHLLQLNPRFHNQRQTGSLIRDVERGTAGVGFLLGAGLFTVVPTLVEFGAVLAVMALGYSAWFTLIIVLTFVAYATYTMVLTQARQLRQRRVNEVDSAAHGRMVDGLLNYETVKTHAREDFERGRYAGVLAQWVEHGVENQRALSRLHIGQSAVIAAGVAAVMLLAGQQTVRGAMTVGDLVLVNAYVLQICLPLNALGFVFREARDALVNTEKMLALLNQQPEIVDAPGAAPLQVRGGEVLFEHVDFAYEAGRPILQDLNLRIGGGQTVAVVGGSGSGKSTLARLLLRLYDAGSGRITVDGQDVRSVRMDSLREAIGVVPQDTTLFNEDIAYNIAYGRPGAGMAEVIEAAKAAQVHEFIMSLPQQYATPVGERGTRLSGGERQRVAIARAFLKNPPIMVFDEATSALDTRAERAIQGELDRIAQGRSTLIIAHRLSTIVGADEIVVMDKGRIVERGRHDELLQRDGLYAQLWNLQRQQQEFERLERRMARQPVNLAAMVADVVDGLRETLAGRRIHLFTQIDAEHARVTGDPSTLGSVLRDLCAWALQATPDGGRIELTLTHHEASARLGVTDGRHLHGHALAAADGGTPMDPLQLRSTVERQGGRFLIELPSSTHGMRYIVELPLRALGGFAPEAARAHAGSAMPAQQPLAGLRVMNIDDLADAREAVALLLEMEGAQVQSCARGDEALAALERQPVSLWPQVIVCDIALGDDDGHEVMRRVRELEARRGLPLDQRIPALALSGLAGPGDRIRSMMTGFQAHLAKPADPHELVSTIYTLAGRSPAGPLSAATSGPQLAGNTRRA